MRGKKYAIRLAKKVSDQYGINNIKCLPIDVEKIAKYFDINIVPHILSENMSGFFFKKEQKLFLAVNQTHNEHRQRFTIAHEIAHYLLHLRNEVLHYDNHLFFRSDNVLSPDEVEANSFAAELLMPEELVDKLIAMRIKSIDELANRFNVSEDAMRYRLTNLGYL